MKRDADRRSTDQWQVQYEDIIFSAKSTGGSGSSISKTKVRVSWVRLIHYSAFSASKTM